MCGIIGAFNTKKAFQVVNNGLEIIRERGRDGCGYYDGEFFYAKESKQLPFSSKDNILGHNLHAIVNTVKQPIIYKSSSLSANCEIYNWKDSMRDYDLNAKNDSELLIKLLVKIE